MIRLLWAALWAFTFTASTMADDWSGQLVMLKDDVKSLGHKYNTGFLPDGRKLGGNGVFKVKSDDGQFVELVGQNGYLYRSEVLPLNDAESFFTVKIQTDGRKGKWLVRRGLARMNAGKNISALISGGHPIPYLDAALADFDEAVRLEPGVALWRTERGICRFQRGEYDLAIDDFNEAIRQNPNAPLANNGRGLAWRAKKEYDKALADFAKVLELDPKNAIAFNNRGLVWVDKKEYGKAVADYTEAATLDPLYAVAFNGRGDAWRKAREWDKAEADFRRAAELDPSFAATLNNLAWLKATCPDANQRDGKAAVAFAKKAVELAPTPSALNSLAAAYAEAGDFEKAVAEQKRALEDKSLPATTRLDYEKRLELFKTMRSYHEK